LISFGAVPSAVNLIWTLLSAISLGAGWYFVFRHFLKPPWVAAGCTLCARYVALPADKAQKTYPRAGWTMLQPGPYWQIWERQKSGS